MALVLAQLNLLLALFNLLPGLPLDGGQIVKALVWQAGGSREKGVRTATRCANSGLDGRGVWGVPVPAHRLLWWLWLLLLGWFALGASRNQLQLLALQRALQHLQVKDSVSRRLRVMEPGKTLRDLSQMRLSNDSPRPDWVLLCQGGRWKGFIDDQPLKQVPVQRWDVETLEQHQRPLSDLPRLQKLPRCGGGVGVRGIRARPAAGAQSSRIAGGNSRAPRALRSGDAAAVGAVAPTTVGAGAPPGRLPVGLVVGACGGNRGGVAGSDGG